MAWTSECPSRIDKARNTVQKAEAALDRAKAAAKVTAHCPAAPKRPG